MWAANRTHTAEENAQYQFGKNGADFGAHSETDYVTKVHAFIDKPPRDLQTLDRANGDRLEYDAKGNTFLVLARNGAPRTMFKPRDGAAYWTQQKDREAKRGKAGQDSGSDQG
jgi:pyocin large subunit-like protein